MACGHELEKAGKEFLLLTKNLGGRMLTSKTHEIDYGASYITTEYKNTAPFIDRGESLRIQDLYFFDGKEFSTAYTIIRKNAFEIPKFIKFILLLNDFKIRLRKLRKASLLQEQRKALQKDPVLLSYLSEDIESFVRRNRFEYLNETFFNPVLNSTAFVDHKHTSVFYYFGSMMPLVAGTYVADFRHTIHRFTKDWKEKINITSVRGISRKKSGKGFILKTSKGGYSCKNIVLALPYEQARTFFDVPKPKNPAVPIYVFHIVGRREEPYVQKKIIFFRPEHHDITILWRQKTGSDIVFSKVPKPDFRKYYEINHIVRRVHWGTSVVLSDENFVKQHTEEGVMLASDYNITGLEDSYITGVYAANKILGKTID